MQLWELVARERIRDTLATYNWSGDAAQLDELAQTFCEDGALQLRGSDPVHGRAAIIDLLGGVVAAPDASVQPKRVVRHNVSNVRFTEVGPSEARVSCYFTVLTEIGLDHYGRYRDVFVPVGGPEGTAWLIRHRFVSTDWRAPNSTMAR